MWDPTVVSLRSNLDDIAVKIVGRFQLYFIGIAHLLDQVYVLFCENIIWLPPFGKAIFCEFDVNTVISVISVITGKHGAVS